MDDWMPTISETSKVARWLAPENKEIWTKIHDDHGERNVAKLTRKGNLWFTEPTGGMYVYYTPTHWKSVQPHDDQ
jgi:hypothetical protein